MSKLDLNGKECEVFSDETLLGAGRREKAHIGYACGGNGLCQTCEVTIHEGMESLSPMNDVEKAWLNSQKQAKGHRLACQARVVGDKKIKLTTRAENARLAFNRAFKEQPKEASTNPFGYPGEFFTWVGIETLEHLQATPDVIVNSAQRFFKGDLKLSLFDDSRKAFDERMPEIQEFFTKTVADVPNIVGDLGKNFQPVFNSAMEFTTTVTNTVAAAVSEVAKTVTSSVTSSGTTDSAKPATASKPAESSQPKVLPVEIKKK